MIGAKWMEKVLGRSGQLRRARVDERFFAGASQDSRRLRPGDLFVALQGENADGASYAPAALDAGAAGVLLADERVFTELAESRDSALFLVDDPLLALQTLASVHLGEVGPRVVAITGSNGKTSTKDICRSLLSGGGVCFASEGNFNNLIGLPMSLLSLKEDADFAVLEMGCSGFGEIARLCELFPPEIGIVTNIAAAHLEQLGDLDGVARAKGELPAALPQDGLLLLPHEEPYAENLAARGDAASRSFGFVKQADVRIEDLGGTSGGGRRFRIEEREGTLPLPTRYALLGLAAAWGVGRHLGIGREALLVAAETVEAAGNRGQLYRLGEWFVMDDSYNANPDSLRAALNWLAEQELGGRRWAVLGDMLELGPDGAARHRELGAEAAELGLDGLWALGPLSAELVEGAREAGLATARHFDSRQDLADALLAELLPGDLILLKGSRGMAMEEVGELLAASRGLERKALV